MRRLVEEDAAEVVAVGEDLGLQRQERPARVDEVDARQVVLLRHLLRAQVLLHRERVVRAALHGRVVGDDHALAALDDADPGHDPGRRRVAVVQVPRGERVQLEEGRAGVEEAVDPLAREELAARAVALDRLLAAAQRRLGRARFQLLHERRHALPVGGEVGRLAVDPRLEHCHAGRLRKRVRSVSPRHRPRIEARRRSRAGRPARRRPPLRERGSRRRFRPRATRLPRPAPASRCRSRRGAKRP